MLPCPRSCREKRSAIISSLPEVSMGKDDLRDDWQRGATGESFLKMLPELHQKRSGIFKFLRCVCVREKDTKYN